MDRPTIRPFVPEDVERLAMQPAQSHLGEFMKHPGYLEALARGDAWTAETGDRIIGCAGIVMIGLHGTAWAMLAHDAGRFFIAIHRAVKRGLDSCPARRIEMHVDVNFEEGHRWARLLGFQQEAPRLRAWLPDGGDVSLYARVREWKR